MKITRVDVWITENQDGDDIDYNVLFENTTELVRQANFNFFVKDVPAEGFKSPLSSIRLYASVANNCKTIDVDQLVFHSHVYFDLSKDLNKATLTEIKALIAKKYSRDTLLNLIFKAAKEQTQNNINRLRERLEAFETKLEEYDKLAV